MVPLLRDRTSRCPQSEGVANGGPLWKRRASRIAGFRVGYGPRRLAAGSDAGLTIANAAESSFSAFSRACRARPRRVG
ncbi:hypothetical protein ABLN97_13635 [Mycobacterium tuberculosis]